MGAVVVELTWRPVRWISTTSTISLPHQILDKAMAMMRRMASCRGRSSQGQPQERRTIVHIPHPEVVAPAEIETVEGTDRSQIEPGATVGSHQVGH